MRIKQTPLKKDISELKQEFLKLETKFHEFSSEIKKREERWNNCEKKMEDLLKINDGIVHLNIGGQIFDVALYTLRSRRNTLFHKQIQRSEIEKDKTIFYDRDPFYFNYILDFLRNGKLNINKMSLEAKDDLLNEAQYYEIRELIDKLRQTVGEVELVKFDLNTKNDRENLSNADNIIYLKDKDLSNGIVTGEKGIITFTLSNTIEFAEIEIGGYKDNDNIFDASRMEGADVSTSLDNILFNKVGVLPANLDSIQSVNITKSKARYIRFSHSEHQIGIGYLEIKEATS